MSGNQTVVAAIAALDHTGVIGNDDSSGAGTLGLPWRLSNDLRRFKALTLEKPVIMGRRTVEAIGKALPNRYNIVLTHAKNYSMDGIVVAHSIDHALALAENYLHERGGKEIMVAGGAQVYQSMWPVCNRLYLTLVDAIFPGSAWFPSTISRLSHDVNWCLDTVEYHPADARNSLASWFHVYHRRQPTPRVRVSAQA